MCVRLQIFMRLLVYSNRLVDPSGVVVPLSSPWSLTLLMLHSCYFIVIVASLITNFYCYCWKVSVLMSVALLLPGFCLSIAGCLLTPMNPDWNYQLKYLKVSNDFSSIMFALNEKHIFAFLSGHLESPNSYDFDWFLSFKNGATSNNTSPACLLPFSV